LLADLGGQPAIALGASLGGLAAVRLACQLGAAGVVSFAGPVHLGEATEGGEGVRLSLTTIFLRDSPGVVDMLRAAPGTRLYQCFGPTMRPMPPTRRCWPVCSICATTATCCSRWWCAMPWRDMGS
jgi:hypothetical protein